MSSCGAAFAGFLLLALCQCSFGSREDECAEVGFARSAGLLQQQSFEEARKAAVERWVFEDEAKDPTYSAFSPELKNVTRVSELLEDASVRILDAIKKTRVGKRCQREWLLRGIERHVVPLINLDNAFAEELGLVMSFRCMVGSPYPNVDGTCVNQESPDIGSVGSKFLRLQPSRHGLEGFTLRGSASPDKSLPSARKVARFIRQHMNEPELPEVFSEWSSFIQRDTTAIPASPKTEKVDCCKTPEMPDCAPMYLEEDDPEYSRIGCINFKRSTPAQAILGHRESMTLVSTYLDATPLYGDTNENAFKQKTGYFGILVGPEGQEKAEDKEPKDEVTKKDEAKVGRGEEKKEEKGEDDKGKSPGKKCAAPDSLKGCFSLNGKEDKFIESVRLLLLLEHNRLADALAEINPHFDDPLLYNEARRILIAQYNAITYGEYLPVLIGEDVVKKNLLQPGAKGKGASYIKEVNPGILSSFALASYRNPSMFSEWRMEWGPTEILDSIQYDSVREDPYQDLLALDVQRARDHGIPNYVTWRRFCDSGVELNSWSDMEALFSKEIAEELKTLYQSELDDPDIHLALMEKPPEGVVVGKTFSCILADQFARLKAGNKMFWEHETSLFTKEQQDTLRETSSLAALLCRNLPVTGVPKNSFIPVSDKNPVVQCSEIPDLDLKHWVDTSLIEKMKELREASEMQNVEKSSRESEL